MQYIAIVALSVSLSWLITDIKSKMHLRQIDETLDAYMNNLKEVHEDFFEKLNQKYKL